MSQEFVCDELAICCVFYSVVGRNPTTVSHVLSVQISDVVTCQHHSVIFIGLIYPTCYTVKPLFNHC